MAVAAQAGVAASAMAGRIGPNAITRLAAALPRHVGSAATRALFRSVGLERHLVNPPEHMVDEAEVRALHIALRREFGAETAVAAARDAGRLTAEYLLGHRIPRPVQMLLRALPAGLAARVLLGTMRRHGWTFAGSGRVNVGVRQGVPWLAIRDNPLCRGLALPGPGCDYYAATLQTLFRALVHPDARALETRCEAAGGAECRFEFRW
jgi:divinyl protochlorophyllide a 8-vinyl-reductase